MKVIGWAPPGRGDAASFQRIVEGACGKDFASVEVLLDAKEASSRCMSDRDIAVVIAKLGNKGEGLQIIEDVRRAGRNDVFCVVFSHTAADHVRSREACFRKGANMVSKEPAALRTAMETVVRSRAERGSLKCPFCPLSDLSPEGLYFHLPLYHITEPNVQDKCPICKKSVDSVQVHVHDNHIPKSEKRLPEDKSGVDLYPFALIVVQRSDGKFLLVQEFGQEWFWLPGGRVEHGERLTRGAVRECLEEAGVQVEITGILSFEYVPRPDYSRLRVVFMGKPTRDDAIPKSLPDFESAGACWATLEEMENIPLRSDEPLEWARYLAQGGTVYPLSILKSY